MRRVLTMAALAAAVFAAAACTGGGSGSTPPTAGASATVTTPTPAPTGDPIVTKQVCAEAVIAAADATLVFNDQLVALEAAAAKGDQTAMLASADTIQKKLVGLASRLKTWSEKSVSPEVKGALADASTALTDIASKAYTGTALDIQKKLSDLSAAFSKACA